MRPPATAQTVRRVLEAIGRDSKGPGRVYLTGGGTAVLHGWRETTADIDLKLDPEPAGVFGAIRLLKDRLSVNVELASPDDFIPALPGWQDRSLFIERIGHVDFFHYDPYAQALAKIERGHTRDLDDVRAMLANSLIDLPRLTTLFEAIVPALERYPSIDPDAFRAKVEAFVAEHEEPV